ncbi:MAG TPA: response regulator transcription factor [Gammaproteobacteria bacterium]|nr:response regulator transcription factor [Gammaproteobacteria bacterium]
MATASGCFPTRKMGAKGYLNKRCETDKMMRALDLIINHGGEYWPSTGGNSVSNGAMRLGITPRQLEVLQLVAEGYSNREIGE